MRNSKSSIRETIIIYNKNALEDVSPFSLTYFLVYWCRDGPAQTGTLFSFKVIQHLFKRQIYLIHCSCQGYLICVSLIPLMVLSIVVSLQIWRIDCMLSTGSNRPQPSSSREDSLRWHCVLKNWSKKTKQWIAVIVKEPHWRPSSFT